MPAPPDGYDYEAAIAACARGERHAMRALYEREGRWLLGVAMRIVRHRQTAEDVLQDAFLQIWKGAHTYKPQLGSARGWIYTVVRHRALSEIRKAGREVQVEADTLDTLAELAGHEHPDEHVDGVAIARCLEALDEQKRGAIVMAYVDGYTQEQIAQRTSAPLGTVKSWIRRGLQSLKECLS
jgi:RNA polymerase sigma-70 factor (ECF subfamily)